jgi:uncharacterized membrane protein YcaP (DUF421 family)
LLRLDEKRGKARQNGSGSVRLISLGTHVRGINPMSGVLGGIFGYCFLVFIVRTAGRRPGRQLSPFDFVLIFFMGGITLTPMVGNDRSIVNAFSIITSVALTHSVIAWLKNRFHRFGLIVDGTPVVLFEKGRWHSETMSKMRIQDQDVMAAARDSGIARLDQIEYAILERNGEISVLRHKE